MYDCRLLVKCTARRCVHAARQETLSSSVTERFSPGRAAGGWPRIPASLLLAFGGLFVVAFFAHWLSFPLDEAQLVVYGETYRGFAYHAYTLFGLLALSATVVWPKICVPATAGRSVAYVAALPCARRALRMHRL